MTLDKLALIVAKGFERTDKKFDKKIDDLALMTARGFDQSDKRFTRLELNDQIIRNDLSEVQQSVSYVKEEVKETNSRLSNLDYKMGKLTKSVKEDIDSLFLSMAKVKQKVGLR